VIYFACDTVSFYAPPWASVLTRDVVVVPPPPSSSSSPCMLLPVASVQVRQRELQKKIEQQQREMEQAAVRMEAARMDAAFLSKQVGKMEEEQRYRQVGVPPPVCCPFPAALRSLSRVIAGALLVVADPPGANGYRQTQQGVWRGSGRAWRHRDGVETEPDVASGKGRLHIEGSTMEVCTLTPSLGTEGGPQGPVT
jgi:hypothetical protein